MPINRLKKIRITTRMNTIATRISLNTIIPQFMSALDMALPPTIHGIGDIDGRLTTRGIATLGTMIHFFAARTILPCMRDGSGQHIIRRLDGMVAADMVVDMAMVMAEVREGMAQRARSE